MNILASGIVGNEIKICSKRTKWYLSEIVGLPHRLEKIGEKRGIIFVEDSKSTSSQSLEAALGSYGDTQNLLLIVGWSDKWDSFSHLGAHFWSRVKSMVCIGATKDAFIKIAKREDIPYISTDSMEEWVEWLYGKWIPWDVLMLSPGCASFGLFHDYLHRAQIFRSALEKLPE
jgi:UDP-N-acetylmuramoylalanine--D-glutamate ligase